MKTNKSISQRRQQIISISQDANSVKARIKRNSPSMGEIASAAGISQSSLSNHLRGYRASRPTQLRIWDAYRRLTGQEISPEDFWGNLFGTKESGQPVRRRGTSVSRRSDRKAVNDNAAGSTGKQINRIAS
jgi:lambda repressor-like predicted transcriptional regulator